MDTEEAVTIKVVAATARRRRFRLRPTRTGFIHVSLNRSWPEKIMAVHVMLDQLRNNPEVGEHAT